MNHFEASTKPEQVLVWEGRDPITFSRVTGALNEAGIESFSVDEHRMSLFSNAFIKGGFAIVVASSDHARASEIVTNLLSQTPSE